MTRLRDARPVHLGHFAARRARSVPFPAGTDGARRTTLVATVNARLEVESLINTTVRLYGNVASKSIDNESRSTQAVSHTRAGATVSNSGVSAGAASSLRPYQAASGPEVRPWATTDKRQADGQHAHDGHARHLVDATRFLQQICGPDDHLRRDAPVVRALTADEVALDSDDRQSSRRQLPGDIFASWTHSDYDDVDLMITAEQPSEPVHRLDHQKADRKPDRSAPVRVVAEQSGS